MTGQSLRAGAGDFPRLRWIWSLATFIGKKKKSRTKRNPELFDSPPVVFIQQLEILVTTCDVCKSFTLLTWLKKANWFALCSAPSSPVSWLSDKETTVSPLTLCYQAMKHKVVAVLISTDFITKLITINKF